MRHPVLKAALLVCAAFVLFFPIPYLAAPQWDVTVVDAEGQPVEGMTVRRTWQNYSLENESHEQDQVTDRQGRATFPPIRAKATPFQWAKGSLMAAAGGVHASFGTHAHVFAFGRGMEGDAITNGYITDWRGQPERMESRIAVR